MGAAGRGVCLGPGGPPGTGRPRPPPSPGLGRRARARLSPAPHFPSVPAARPAGRTASSPRPGPPRSGALGIDRSATRLCPWPSTLTRHPRSPLPETLTAPLARPACSRTPPLPAPGASRGRRGPGPRRRVRDAGPQPFPAAAAALSGRRGGRRAPSARRGDTAALRPAWEEQPGRRQPREGGWAAEWGGVSGSGEWLPRRPGGWLPSAPRPPAPTPVHTHTPAGSPPRPPVRPLTPPWRLGPPPATLARRLSRLSGRPPGRARPGQARSPPRGSQEKACRLAPASGLGVTWRDEPLIFLF